MGVHTECAEERGKHRRHATLQCGATKAHPAKISPLCTPCSLCELDLLSLAARQRAMLYYNLTKRQKAGESDVHNARNDNLRLAGANREH